ncbi:MAG: VOC family protein [Actinomycetia bacterium]|nr:VOC family protein [Actinomycetes bacterium]
MSNVARIGGVFFRSNNPAATAEWYRTHLGVPVEQWDTTHGATLGEPGHEAVWAAFAADTDYFGPSKQQFMINLVTPDIVATLESMRAAGVEVADQIQESEFGKFAWAVDCDGRRVELWQP